MPLALYAHPLSSYCWKVLIALYENDVAFEYRELGEDFPQHGSDLAALSPMGKLPLLVDGAKPVAETSVIIEYLHFRFPGPQILVPQRDSGLNVRFLDRFFDNYVMTPMQVFVADRLRPDDQRDQFGVEQARDTLDRAYAWAEANLPAAGWAAGENFTMADCAAAPSLFYADKVHPLGDRFPNLSGYLDRLLARPSFARVLAEKEPYWHMFPFADSAAKSPA